MSVVYSLTAINARLAAVVTTIDASGNGFVILKAGATTICSIQLAVPCGLISGGVLTFSGTLSGTAVAAGSVDNAIITDALSNTVVSGLTAGIPGDAADIIISNGLNSTFINTAQTVQLLSATITGS